MFNYFLGLSIVLFTQVIWARSYVNPASIPLDGSTFVYHKMWAQYNDRKSSTYGLAHFFEQLRGVETDPELKKIINGGEKLLKWVELINAARSNQDQIRISAPPSPNDVKPTIDNPKTYSAETIKKSFEEIQQELSSNIKETVYGSREVTNQIPSELSQEQFISQAKLIFKIYGNAVRWVSTILPNLDYYKERRAGDVRGFYQLSKVTNLQEKLKTFDSLSDKEKVFLSSNLFGLCLNGAEDKICTNELEVAIRNQQLELFYKKYQPEGLKAWNSFFDLFYLRNDVVWSSSVPNKMNMPFLFPGLDRVAQFLKINVEDEFKTTALGLNLDFVNNSSNNPAFVNFVTGETPHVSFEEGHSPGEYIVSIVMDANIPLDEYDAQWTIRHEFAHVLGFPDCYMEFYDTSAQAVVYYAIDPNDIMCAYGGKFNERMFSELKRNYFKP